MSGNYSVYPSTSGGSGGGLSSVSFSVGVLDGQAATPQGASVSSNSIFMQSATGTFPGLVNSTSQTFSGVKTFSQGLVSNGSVSMGSNKISALLDPTTAQEAATKNYVDTQLSAFQPLEAVALASTIDYPGLLVANVLTITATGAISIDGSTPNANDRILLKNQTTQAQNGVYVVTGVGSVGVSPILTRAGDYNTAAEVNSGASIPVISGAVNKFTIWIQTATVVTINTDALVFSQYGANPQNIPISVGAINGAAASLNGAVIGSSTLYLQAASAANPGLVSSAAQTFAGVKTFNGEIIAPGGIGLGALGTLSIGADVNSQFIVIGSGTASRIGFNMNAPQAAIHYGSSLGNGNATSGTVGSFSVILGKISTANNVGQGAVIIGGFSGGMTASGQGSIALGDAGCRAEASFAVAIGDGALAQSLASVAIGNAAQVTSAQNSGIAIGASTIVQGLNSVAAGNGVTAAVAAQTVVGSYNILSTGAAGVIGSTDETFVVGIGTGAAARVNALSCTRDGGTRFYTSSGSAYIALYVGTTTSYAVTLPGTAPSPGQLLTAGSGTAQMTWGNTVPSMTIGSVTMTSSTGGNAYTVSWPGTQASTTASYAINNGAGSIAWLPANQGTPSIFTASSGSQQTYTLPTSPFRPGWLKIRIFGGGGGGGGSGTNGSTTTGSSSGSTAFGGLGIGSSSYIWAGGGGNGTKGSAGLGGTASLGSGSYGIAMTGNPGGPSTANAGILTFCAGGNGGSSPLGGGGGPGNANNSGTAAAANSGSGGGGGGTSGPIASSNSGGGGASGGYVETTINCSIISSVTFTYTVGEMGYGGSPGNNGFGGSNGANGFIIIEAFY